ncbi:MAG: hypothetical protein U0T73_09675 [Chitinophagales bacterium]
MIAANFESVNRAGENKNRAIALSIAFVVHALLLLLLFFWVLTTPNPPFVENEGGMTVNFGTSEVGTGDEQPMNLTPVAANTAPAPEQSASTASESQEDVATQDLEEAPVIEKKTEVKKKAPKPNPDATFHPEKTNNAPAQPVKPAVQVDKNALFTPGAPGKPNNSKGDGEGGGKGDQGDPNGDPNSRNYKGGGDGIGGSGGSGLGDGNVRLTGRKLRTKPAVKNPCEDARGRVVISIKVNRDGRVTNAAFTQSGSTTSDDCLVNVAKQAAMKYTFDDKADASEVQTGSIIFIFKEN